MLNEESKLVVDLNQIAIGSGSKHSDQVLFIGSDRFTADTITFVALLGRESNRKVYFLVLTGLTVDCFFDAPHLTRPVDHALSPHLTGHQVVR